MNERIKRIVRLLIIADCLILLFIAGIRYGIPSINSLIHPIRYIKCDEPTLQVPILYMDGKEAAKRTVDLTRGTQVRLRDEGEEESSIEYQGEIFQVPNQNLATSLQQCVDTKTVYPRRLISLYESKNGKLSNVVAKKGEALQVRHVDENDLDLKTGIVKWYEITKDDKTYWVPGKYVEPSKESALANYGSSIQYLPYWDAYYGEGYSKDAYIDQVDYKSNKKEAYEDNVMPEHVKAYHVSLENLIKNKNELLQLSKKSGINAFVVEIKDDNGILYYDSKAAKDYLKDPQDAIIPIVSNEELKKIFKEYEKSGYYMIARIVTFKDPIFATQNPKESYTDESGNLINHEGFYWPSPYSRKAWMYNVSIAKEIAPYVNEIQFDYVRFPDGTLQRTLDHTGDFHNQYNESKVAALQGFLAYAKDQLEETHTYTSADVFAWPIISKDDQDIGQFLPAIANVVDVVSPMPYLDHFSLGAMDIPVPMEAPRETLSKFTALSHSQLSSLKDAAKYRTWIQGYQLDPYSVQQEIEGIQDQGYDDYMVWSGAGNMEDINAIVDGLK
ncbi:putative glycoside hydrolase [Dubosiella newyorkensis]|uniref:DUF4015 domain-containing protein n=4 Tax=Dubosiella newyorkensis TaxID=1862672 RepID=A0A1U7NQM3_9FIRM|nr:putative glycoside hydrolase [Dubosiella newyorkensis]OLU47933.1 hypothetical protein BO225_00420 [Dubosiella newyorkensis]